MQDRTTLSNGAKRFTEILTSQVLMAIDACAASAGVHDIGFHSLLKEGAHIDAIITAQKLADSVEQTQLAFVLDRTRYEDRNSVS